MERKTISIAEYDLAAALAGLPFDHLQLRTRAIRSLQVIRVVGTLDNDRIDQEPLEIDADIRIRLQVKCKVGGELLDHPARIQQRTDRIRDVRNQNFSPCSRPGCLNVTEREMARVLCIAGQDEGTKPRLQLHRGLPLHMIPEGKSLESASPLPSMQHATGNQGLCRIPLPGAAQITKIGVGL